ncbi:hypothetical protein L2D14_12995 [Thalassospiraceae bacterium LMO-JJ14]|nr:hypothetical protein L2D14_12995 [Thalassospiraceae bacterium LMO-JJ14]
MPRIGIITGVKSEEAALAPVMGTEDAPYVRLSGARPSRARDGVAALIGLGVDGILSFGSAGGVSPLLQPGDLVIADRVMNSDGHAFAADSDWCGRLAAVFNIQTSIVAGVDYVAGSEDKAWFKREGIAALDMESHIVAAMADEAGIPFAVLRAIIDPAGYDIPGYALDSVRPDGSISLLPVIAGVCLQPWTIGRLLDLNRYNRQAMESLSGATRVLGPGFGFFAL